VGLVEGLEVGGFRWTNREVNELSTFHLPRRLGQEAGRGLWFMSTYQLFVANTIASFSIHDTKYCSTLDSGSRVPTHRRLGALS